MPKRQSSPEPCGGDAAAKRPAQRKQHLYIVVNDWAKGYSIHKVDVAAFDSDSDSDSDGSDTQPQPFPEPPLARLECSRGYSYSIAAHGATIVAMKPRGDSPVAPAFDTALAAPSAFPLPKPKYRFVCNIPIMVSVAGKLFLFVSTSGCYLADPPTGEPWSWTRLDPRPPIFDTKFVWCYAVHLDGRTIFMSAEKFPNFGAEGTSYAFDTERLEWTRVSGWLLPFEGRAHYDAEMDAWVVGLCRHKGGRGHLCSSDVAPVGAASTLPRWKLLEERLFHAESPSHIGARIVYMGGSRFCVVESVWHKDDESKMLEAKKSKRYVGPDRVVLSITTFSLGYDDDGELRLSSRRARDCRVFNKARLLEEDVQSEPVAFWI